MTDETIEALNIREKLVHIDQMQANIHQMFADRDRKHQEIRLTPWQLVVTGMAAGGGLLAAGLAAGAALAKLFGG